MRIDGEQAGASLLSRLVPEGAGDFWDMAAAPAAPSAPAPDVVMVKKPQALPNAPSTGRRRLYCPVLGCPEGNCVRAQGWADPSSLRMHMEGHASGRYLGDFPREWQVEQGLSRQPVHGLQPPPVD